MIAATLAVAVGAWGTAAWSGSLRATSANVISSAAVFGTNMPLFDGNEQMLTNSGTQQVLASWHPPVIRMPFRTNLSDSVEIRIRDNGTGIPPEAKEKLFNPFFTTKPAGEGTGLGLSITHDIIVKQHSGSIEVDTLPGEFTEIRITLPRTATFIAESGGRA